MDTFIVHTEIHQEKAGDREKLDTIMSERDFHLDAMTIFAHPTTLLQHFRMPKGCYRLESGESLQTVCDAASEAVKVSGLKVGFLVSQGKLVRHEGLLPM